MTIPVDDRVVVSTFTTAGPDTAFQVFTEGIQSWWNPGHHVLQGEQKVMGVEPFVGGRLWDETVDGRTCTWGRVLTWAPGRMFAFSWLIGPDWAVPAENAPGSRVTVTFIPESGGTRVELVHDQLSEHGPGWENVHAGVGSPGGWPAGLQHFAEVASAA